MKKQIITIVATAAITFFGYLFFDSILTPKATVVEEAAGEVLVMGHLMTPDPTHPAMGMFEVVAAEGGERRINFGADFSIAHAPDPHVRVNGMIIAKVVNYEGAQSYPIPNYLGDVETVHVWCEIANVSLGNGMINGVTSDMMPPPPMPIEKDMEMPMPEEGDDM